MVELPEDKTLQPGSWYLWKTGRKRVFLACPLCGQIILVDPQDTEILHDGRLAKILECPNASCDFKDAVQLKGWKGRDSSSILPKV